MRITIILSFIVLTFCSCSKTRIDDLVSQYKSQTIIKYRLKRNGHLTLILDSLSSNNTHYIQPLTDAQKFAKIALFNRNISSIDLYQLSSDSVKLFERIKWPLSGPNGMENAKAFYFLNKDSIYLFNGDLNQCVLYNANFQKLLEVVGMNLPKSRNHDVLGYIGTTYKPIYFDSSFYTTGLSYHHDNISPAEYFEEYSRNIVRIDLKNEDVDYYLKYSEVYSNGQFYPLEYEYKSITKTHIDNESVLVSFPADKNLYLLENGICKLVIVLDINYYRDVDYMAEFNVFEREKGTIHLWENPYHAAIEYDNINKLYYRISFMKSEIPKEAIGKFPWKFKREFQITIFDTDFNVVGSRKFTKSDNLLPMMYFVSGGQLYINKIVEEEDAMVFEKFELVSI